MVPAVAQRHVDDRLLDHRRRERAQGPRARGRPHAASIDAPVSGGTGGAKAATLTFMCRRRGRGVRRGEADPRGDGQEDRALRRRGCGAGGENLQQHDPRHFDDRRQRGVCARRKARPVASGVVRRRIDFIGAMLVADDLLPGAGAGAGVARQQRLQAGLRRSVDAEGSALSQEARRPRARRRRSASMREEIYAGVRRGRAWRRRFFRDHQPSAR